MPTALVGLAVAAMGLVFAALIFVPAGRLDWTLGWIYVGIVVLFVVINWACLLRWNPELRRATASRACRGQRGCSAWRSSCPGRPCSRGRWS
jgi:protein-S-isoprenylcysteine O-methyltransferase Ste14